MIETVAILIPTKGRAKQLIRNVAGLLAGTVPNGVELAVILAVCEDDVTTKLAATHLSATDGRVFIASRQPNTTAVQGWNQAAAAIPSADWYVLGADDIEWADDWLVEAMKTVALTGAKVIGLNDGHTDLRQYAPHYMVHRDFLWSQFNGAMVPPEYKSWWFDREVCERARGMGLYATAWNSRATHCHPDWHTAPDDETYRAGKPYHDEDRATYLKRMEI